MVKAFDNQYEPDYVSRPGDTLAEILGDRHMSQRDFADRTGRTPKYVNEVIRGKARITPDAAIVFERVLGIPSSFWNNRQRHYDAHVASLRESRSLASEVAWASHFPYRAMSKWGWIPDTSDRTARVKNLLNFFGVAAPTAWKAIWASVQVEYRKSGTVGADEYGLAAWLRKGELIAQERECEPFNPDKFRDCLRQIRDLTTTEPAVFKPRLNEICAQCGVVVAFVPELPKTASGATRWLTSQKALLQLSLRYKTDDQLWFTFFHEAAHILNHQKRQIFIEGCGARSGEEDEANEFATKFLIPLPEFRDFVRSHPSRQFSKADIKAFACRLGIAPGIVVGRLQHEKMLAYTHCNDLKQRLTWVLR